jgi:hypothetical protein
MRRATRRGQARPSALRLWGERRITRGRRPHLLLSGTDGASTDPVVVTQPPWASQDISLSASPRTSANVAPYRPLGRSRVLLWNRRQRSPSNDYARLP